MRLSEPGAKTALTPGAACWRGAGPATRDERATRTCASRVAGMPTMDLPRPQKTLVVIDETAPWASGRRLGDSTRPWATLQTRSPAHPKAAARSLSPTQPGTTPPRPRRRPRAASPLLAFPASHRLGPLPETTAAKGGQATRRGATLQAMSHFETIAEAPRPTSSPPPAEAPRALSALRDGRTPREATRGSSKSLSRAEGLLASQSMVPQATKKAARQASTARANEPMAAANQEEALEAASRFSVRPGQGALA